LKFGGILKGIVLAGGSGSRLWPITRGVSKQLLPVYDKPLIYYPISTLMSAGISDITVITTPFDQLNFQRLLGAGDKYGITFNYATQESPDGLAQAFLLAKKFIEGEKCALVLGDNIFHGQGLGSQLREFQNVNGAQIFAYQVSDPSQYGVVEFSSQGRVISIEEKPTNPKSKFAIPGLYFYDETAVIRTKSLARSSRGELEITDLNRSYLVENLLRVKTFARGTTWLDMGTPATLLEAAEYVRIVQDRQGLLIGSPEEAAWRAG